MIGNCGMGKRDPRIDACIAKSADFAQPTLKHLRKLMHRADPQIQKTLKWGMPSFTRHGIVCNMAAFKRRYPARNVPALTRVEWRAEPGVI